MDTRASTRTRLSVLPVFFALLFNVMAPVLTTALPDIAPEPITPQAVSAASDPQHVTFTLQGCRNPSVDLEATNFVCADANYTNGNLGKTWNELDLVPHRLTTSLGNQAAATTLYTVAIVADHIETGVSGYDDISAPVVNTALSDASCSITAGPLQTVTPGIGGTDTSMYRLVDISQAKGTTCVFDYYERLALGSAGFPGSSLHSNMTNQSLGTQGVGAQDVSIPVKEILPQELDKEMSAARGQAYPWTVSKSASPTSLDFPNTCLDTPSARSQQVQITVTWTRGEPTATGATTITTNIYATNPAHRTITVDVTDRIYEGLTQATLLDQVSSGPVDVSAGATLLVLTHQFAYSGTATQFNDIATATYTDKVTAIPVPGQTTATASATAQASSDPAANSTVLVTDTESITGTGLAFSVAALGAGNGAFTNYTAGTPTTGPVEWEHTVSSSGSVTFTKTVTVDEPRITSGSLTDTAKIFGDGSVELSSDTESVAIATDALVELTISKTIPSGSLRSGESVTFDFSVAGPGGPHSASITFNSGDPLTKTTTLNGLAPGSYTVSELPEPGWAGHSDQSTDITLPDCDATVSFTNATLAPNLSITKEADDETVTAGEPIGFEIVIANGNDPQTGAAKDVALSDALPGGDGIDWEIASVTGTGGFSPAADACAITGDPGDQALTCDFGDLDPGEGASIAVTSDTTGESCKVYENTAWLHASNADSISANDSTEVLCPDLELVKDGSDPVSAGDKVQFTLTVTNQGDGTASDVVLTDTLPGTGLGAWSIVDTENIDEADCGIVGDVLTCSVDEVAAGAWFSLTVEAMADAGACPSVANDASVSASNEPEDDEFSNEDSFTITVNCPDVTVDKEPIETPISAGEEGRFSITVTNLGPGSAYDVEVVDTAPAGTTWTVLDDDGFSCSSEENSGQQTLTCTLDELAAGEGNARTILIGYSTGVADCGLLDNAVAVSAFNEAAGDTLNNEDEASIIVECPGLNLIKTADADPIDAGAEASFTITIWNAGPGTAFDVEFEDALPAGLGWSFELLDGFEPVSCESSADEAGTLGISCALGDLADGEEVQIRVFADTDRADCGLLENLAWAEASNNERVEGDATIEVKCPTLALDKENDADAPVLPGTTVTYTLTLTVDDGPATDVEVVDALPAGLDDPTAISDGGAFDDTAGTITWSLGDLADGEYTLTYQATVSASAEQGDELVNVAAATSTNSQCPDLDSLEPECEDTSTVVVRVPTLVIDKEADADLITIALDADGDIDSVEPEVVTWTLTYALSNGPVTNAVISDELPAGLVYVDGSASDGGVYDAATNTLTWIFTTLSESGSVTFETEVDPETISRAAPTVNVAMISSDETPEDTGEDQVSVTVEQELGGNPTPTPKPRLPDTAVGIGFGGQPVVFPVELLVALFAGSLGAMALANVKAVRSRRR